MTALAPFIAPLPSAPKTFPAGKSVCRRMAFRSKAAWTGRAAEKASTSAIPMAISSNLRRRAFGRSTRTRASCVSSDACVPMIVTPECASAHIRGRHKSKRLLRSRMRRRRCSGMAARSGRLAAGRFVVFPESDQRMRSPRGAQAEKLRIGREKTYATACGWRDWVPLRHWSVRFGGAIRGGDLHERHHGHALKLPGEGT